MNEDWIDIQSDPEHVSRERQKARELRKTAWWREQLTKGICHYCKKKFKPDELTMDHIIPVARGGRSSKGNIVPCCKECNNKKKYLTPVEMILNQLSQETENNMPDQNHDETK